MRADSQERLIVLTTLLGRLPDRVTSKFDFFLTPD